MTGTTERPQAQQSRSRETEHRILDAAVRVLGEQGVEGLTTANVSVAAGVAVGSIYRRFGNKEQLLLATQRQFLSVFEGQVRERMLEATDEIFADPARTIEHITIAFADAFSTPAAQLRALMLVGLQNPVVFADGHGASVRGGRVYADLILRHRDAIKHDDPEAAVDFTYRLIYAACSHRLTQGDALESDRPFSWEGFKTQLARSNCAYLLTGLDTLR